MGKKKGERAPKKGLTYADAGVDIDAGEAFATKIRRMMESTYSPRVIPAKDGYAGMFAIDYDQKLFRKNYKKPVLIASNDGVGTKLKVAFTTGKHDTVGIDCVAMCVNDLICMGAEPIFFLDYIGIPKTDLRVLGQIAEGLVEGCHQAECALLGGETAELPGLYAKGEYDLAGFSVGIADRGRLVPAGTAEPGDVLIGLGSSGLHSNGYSLARKIFFEIAGMKAGDYVEEFGCTLGEELLKPTRIYVKAIKAVLRGYRVKKVVKGICHITGGGLINNVPRALGPKVDAVIEKKSFPVHPVFKMLAKLGKVAPKEMYRTFNMGIGMVLIVSPYYVPPILKKLKRAGEAAYEIGRIKDGTGQTSVV